jgi:signal transduction histidine kinase
METIKDSGLATLLPFCIVIFIISIGVVLLNLRFQKNLFVQKLEQESLKRLHQTELLRSSIYVQEEERKRVAQDLHDELGAVLSIMRMHLLQLREPLSADATKTDGLQNALQLSETALANVRNISHRLMPPQLEKFGLVKTLDAVFKHINTAGPISVTFTFPDNMPELTWEESLGLYRIVMELVNNTIKHAGARQIQLELTCNSDFISCRYTDDGNGFEPGENVEGWGLKSIEARMNSLNGSVKWNDAKPEHGFSASILLPSRV